MNEALINRSSALELATYMIADAEFTIAEGTSLQAMLNRLERSGANPQYIGLLKTAIANDPSVGNISILKTSNNSGYSSPMGAVCFKDGDKVYVQYRGTPDGGWVHNPISYGADIGAANATDGVSSQIQADGLDFFNKCVSEFAGYGFPGDLIVGGHSQGGNMAEYVTIMSEYSTLIDLCVSLDGPNHSRELYEYILETYGAEYLAEMSEKIIAINGCNDYVNMQGQVSFASDKNTYYLNTVDGNDFVGWHDPIFMFNPEIGKLYPIFDENGNKIEQGPIGQMMTEIVSAINTLPQEQQEDSAMVIMALLELTMGSKNWDDVQRIGINADSWGKLLISEEFIGLMAHGLPALIGEVISNPVLLAQVLNKVIPDDIKDAITNFINNAPAPVVIGVLAIAGIIAGTAVVAGAVVIGIYKIVDFIIPAVQRLKQFADKAWQAVISICTAIKNGIADIARWFLNTFNAGVRYTNSNPYFKVDTAKLRSYATRINNVNNRLRNLDGNLRGLYWQVGLLDIWDILVANTLTSGSPTLNQVKSYLNDSADRFDAAENKARGYVKG
ncbi:Twin-arginine translocation pathway, signal sequence, bacterial/archaeal [Desulfitobacterium hafniense]|uniref:Twin-arginine translocation pathway, signal sequence, bacterial/archaeal n=1 Tax=Desulfitobacterium hafniense TaxID=49338 RepID=A0A098BAP8_DESHA|nr:Mbeg1-like protein [Desulfitobacterium hafniense]CDX04956.1 Twin-arginine translocation pathway, signal sequence, bacterial/archaeal [Desulfitobacterium hafniense]